MKDVLQEAGVKVTPENKKEVDRAIHRLAEVAYKDCSTAWKSVKAQIKGHEKDRSGFIERLKAELEGR
jgi:hypothetical protein